MQATNQFSSWVDEGGIARKTPTGKKLHFPRCPLHAALRAHVYRRDNFTCQMCGTRAKESEISDPASYTGRETLIVDRTTKKGNWTCLVIDHVVSRRNGGSNHPNNLQTLCDPCNSAKSGLVDAKGQR